MAKEKQKPYEFLSNLVLALMGTDRIFSNSFFSSEFAISPNTLSEIRRGEDMCIYQYVRVIRCMTKYLHLIIQLDMLLKELRTVLASNCDLVVATVPHRFHGICQPKEWVVVMQWDGVKLWFLQKMGHFFNLFARFLSLFNFFYIFAFILRNTDKNSLIYSYKFNKLCSKLLSHLTGVFVELNISCRALSVV